MTVEFNVPGSGRDWKKAYALTMWLSAIMPDAEVRYSGLHSDTGVVVFKNDEDATVFKLKFPQWT